MKCPRDHTNLYKVLYEKGIEVDRCQQCDGVWLDRGELEKVQEALEHDYSAELSQIPNYAIQAYLMAQQKMKPNSQCPKCAVDMRKKEYGYCSQIIIDFCPACGGVWLDKGEIEALEVFFERSHVETGDIRKGFFGSLLNFFL